MSPTSYQAAPPRAKSGSEVPEQARKVVSTHHKVKTI